ncbi:MAG: hypothetical protein C6H99_01445 [Epsilonproteobacteria bacterium]|nr:hypothetical protein [Campylobacterota bacterium]NPA63899.1 hypothetical protein [Campylobacterota bacterium]
MQKRHIVLEGVIEEYLKTQEPVSSKQLQEHLPITLSSATIRYYFKQLTQNGYLQKRHISSGRIPSQKSLRQYWRARLRKRTFRLRSFPDLEALADRYEVVCEYSRYKRAPLQEVQNYDNRFLVVVFGDEELILAYNEKVEKFLDSLVGKEALDVAEHCMSVGLMAAGQKIKSFATEEFELYNLEELLRLGVADSSWAKANLVDIVKGRRLAWEKPGLRFEGKYLSYKFFVISEKRAEVLLLGELHKDYCAFLKNLDKE